MLKEIYNDFMKKLILPKKNYLNVGIARILVLLIGYLDYITGHEICFSLFYIIPIALATLGGNYIWGLVFSAISTVFWITGETANGMTFSHYSIL